jgi:hypothetical protein
VKTLLVAVLCVVGLLIGRPAAAQIARDPLATLVTWADDVWISLLDRDGGWAGRLSDAGIFQRFNPDEDSEYQLDLRTALFSHSEDARWSTRPTGLRGAAGSIDHPHIAQFVEWRERFLVSSRWTLAGSLLRERTLAAARDHVRAGLFWQPASSGLWDVGATVGVHFFKPSSDVELVVGRTWRGEDGDRGRVRLRLALLDAFNEAIFQGLGVNPEDADAHFDYQSQPIAIRADGTWRAGVARLELRGGVSRRSTVRVTFPEAGDPSYDLSERVAFVGGLAEVDIGTRTTLAALASIARGDTERLSDTPSATDLSLREVTRAVGIRARQDLAGSFALEADLVRTDRPEELQQGWRGGVTGPSSSSLEREDRESFAGLALVRRPLSGWTGRLFYASVDRESDASRTQLTDRNTRLVTDFGYRFASGFDVTAGVRWDLDGGREPKFDGGQLRFATGPRQ